MNFPKPMLASPATDLHTLNYPVLGSPKLDGVRCITWGGRPYSRNGKVIPNLVLQDMLSGLPNMDGELIIGDPTAKDVYNKTMSGVMSEEGVPKVTFCVFDIIPRENKYTFAQRIEMAENYANACASYVERLPHLLLESAEKLIAYEARIVDMGYEGVMIRDPNALYKHGRSTLREGGLLKIKRFADSEAIILGFVELMTNNNEKTRDELGRAKRSSHKANLAAAGRLGALMVRDVKSGVEFEIGTGFTDEQREGIWENRDAFEGETVKYKYQPAGVKDKPRFPVFLGMRPDGA